jgi:signal transduction histidine kinase/Tol biopolymer transport system component
VAFLCLMLILGGALSWLGWQLLDQDRTIEKQRVLERLELAADRIVTHLRSRVSELDKWLDYRPGSGAKEPPAYCAVLRSKAENLAVYPEGLLLFYPEVSTGSEPPADIFAEGELLEFQRNQPAAAAEAFGKLARSKDPAVRAGALLRHGRDLRKAGRHKEALADTGLPWTLRVASADPGAELAGSSSRRRLLLWGFAVLGLVLVAGSYFILRSIERERSVGRLQSEFVSTVSHEFRTPLTSLRQLSEMLAKGRVPTEDLKQQTYDILTRESERLQRLVESLLDFGRVEAHAFRYQFESLDAGRLAGEVAAEFQEKVAAAGFTIDCVQTADGLPVRADREALRLALRNLLDNAVKYSPACRTVRIESGREHDRAAIKVIDKGMGIPESEQKKIFRKFERGAASRAANIHGTGFAIHQTKDTRAEVALQAAMKKEAVDGDLKSAIDQYKKIISTYKDNRAVVAKALVRMGACYERLGDKDARAAYQRVVTDYTDQLPTSSEARARLGVLASGKPISTTASFRQTSMIPGDGAPSPDGRYFAYTSWDGDNLWIRNLDTGAERKLNVQDKAYSPSWSPDGTRIAFVTIYGNKICIVNISGLDASDARIIFEPAKDDSSLDLIGWLSDQNSILVYFGKSTRLAQISAVDGAVKNLRTATGISMSSSMLSPDGRYIACMTGTARTTTREIVVIPVAGGDTHPITSIKQNDRLLGWEISGRSILFASDRGGSFDLWRGGVSEGKPTGEFEQLRSDLGKVRPLGSTQNGSLYFGIQKIYKDLNVSILSLDDGEIARPYLTASVGKENIFHIATWSPDGERLAYLASSNQSNFPSTLGIWSPANGREWEIKLANPLAAYPLSWSKDGNSILGRSSTGGKETLLKVDHRSGKTEILISVESMTILGWLPDANRVFVRKWDAKSKVSAIFAINRIDGSEKELFRADAGFSLISFEPVSPGGKWLAIGTYPSPRTKPEQNSQLLAIPTEGGEVRNLLASPTIPLGQIQWTADAKHILCSGSYQGNEGRWIVPFDEGAPRKLDKIAKVKNLVNLSFTPDGKRVAFVTLSGDIEEVWVMENLPPMPPKK